MDQAKLGQPGGPDSAEFSGCCRKLVWGRYQERATWSCSWACGLHTDGNNVGGRDFVSFSFLTTLLQNKVKVGRVLFFFFFFNHFTSQ